MVASFLVWWLCNWGAAGFYVLIWHCCTAERKTIDELDHAWIGVRGRVPSARNGGLS